MKLENLTFIGKDVTFIKSLKSKKAVPILSLDIEGFSTMDNQIKEKIGENSIFVSLDHNPNLKTFLSKVQR